MASIATPSRNLYWCHQCAAEMTPMMVPDPMCSNCQSEFVEKIEEDNDPRTFAEPEPEDDDDDDEHEVREHLSLEDLFRLFQTISNPPPHMREGSSQQRQRRTQQQQQQQHQPGEFPTGGHPILLNPFQVGSRTGSGSGSRPAQNTDEDGDVDMENTAQDNRPEGPMIPGPPMSLAELLGRLGMGLQMSEGGAGGGFGGGLFNLPGNPGDYVFSQGGLDDVISQMMEMQSRSGPVGASDEIINSIPEHKITPEELDAKTECSVCQDKFTEQDGCLQLKCKHIFHEDCIKPWLKTSATCPTCRCSLIPEEEAARRPLQDSAESSASSSPNLPGSFPTASGNNHGQNPSNSHSSRSITEDLD